MQPPNMLPSHLITLILSIMLSKMKKDKSSMVCAALEAKLVPVVCCPRSC